MKILDRSEATYCAAIFLVVVQLLILVMQVINSSTILVYGKRIEYLSNKLSMIQEEQVSQLQQIQQLTRKLGDGASATPGIDAAVAAPRPADKKSRLR